MLKLSSHTSSFVSNPVSPFQKLSVLVPQLKNKRQKSYATKLLVVCGVNIISVWIIILISKAAKLSVELIVVILNCLTFYLPDLILKIPYSVSITSI
jgi:hypothetical protein